MLGIALNGKRAFDMGEIAIARRIYGGYFVGRKGFAKL